MSFSLNDLHMTRIGQNDPLKEKKDRQNLRDRIWKWPKLERNESSPNQIRSTTQVLSNIQGRVQFLLSVWFLLQYAAFCLEKHGDSLNRKYDFSTKNTPTWPFSKPPLLKSHILKSQILLPPGKGPIFFGGCWIIQKCSRLQEIPFTGAAKTTDSDDDADDDDDDGRGGKMGWGFFRLRGQFLRKFVIW